MGRLNFKGLCHALQDIGLLEIAAKSRSSGTFWRNKPGTHHIHLCDQSLENRQECIDLLVAAHRDSQAVAPLRVIHIAY